MKPVLQRIGELTPAIEELFAGVSDPLHEFENVRSDIQSGRAQLYKVYDASYLVLQRDGDDLLVCAYVGVDANTATEICVEIARQSHMHAVRFHTGRKGLARLIKKFEPQLVQQVYRIPVT